MRNAAASFDDDFGYDAAARKKTPRKPRTPLGKQKTKKGKRFGFAMHRAARYGAIGMSATVVLGIMINALALQKSRHPAPLFGKAIALGGTVAPATSAKKPVTVPTSAAVEDAPPGAESTTDASAPHAKLRRSAAIPDGSDDKSVAVDPIARLLQSSASGIATGDKPEPKRVLGAQRALVKLGFVLKPNGTFGPATRKAVELFEKDRHLPMKGELTRRLVKILSAESGVKID